MIPFNVFGGLTALQLNNNVPQCTTLSFSPLSCSTFRYSPLDSSPCLLLVLLLECGCDAIYNAIKLSIEQMGWNMVSNSKQRKGGHPLIIVDRPGVSGASEGVHCHSDWFLGCREDGEAHAQSQSAENVCRETQGHRGPVLMVLLQLFITWLREILLSR